MIRLRVHRSAPERSRPCIAAASHASSSAVPVPPARRSALRPRDAPRTGVIGQRVPQTSCGASPARPSGELRRMLSSPIGARSPRSDQPFGGADATTPSRCGAGGGVGGGGAPRAARSERSSSALSSPPSSRQRFVMYSHSSSTTAERERPVRRAVAREVRDVEEEQAAGDEPQHDAHDRAGRQPAEAPRLDVGRERVHDRVDEDRRDERDEPAQVATRRRPLRSRGRSSRTGRPRPGRRGRPTPGRRSPAR